MKVVNGLLLGIAVLATHSAWAQIELARQLVDEGDHSGAALEFRRVALQSEGTRRGGFLWAAAHEYYRSGDYERADKLLGLAEADDPALRVPVLLLRGETAGALKLWEESAFYHEGVASAAKDSATVRYAARKAAAAKVHAGHVEGARAVLAGLPAEEDSALAALEAYSRGRDRSPLLGGALGMIPGAGYFYAGEWANGLRSLILNSIFIFGMVHTAQEEQWGAFAVITFFEFTWYSGSVYGGIDASHRYNRRRLETCVRSIVGGAAFEPDYDALPAVSLRYRF